ncbi:MAG: hypothetical protein RLP15_12345 [Cryomorphaceae bacterium]
MPKELGILVLHGMGSQATDYAEPMIKEVKRRLGDNAARIAWEPVYYADVVEESELRYLREVNDQGLDFWSLRKFIVKALGDAVAYQQPQGAENDAYRKINERVNHSMQRLRAALGDPDKPLIVMAHSLGCVVASNYIWDVQRGKWPDLDDFTSFKTLNTLVTFGSNLPLFSFAYAEPVAIALPEGAKWYNYYDKDDVLGFPLKPISTSYEQAVTADIQINVGGIATSWNPASHTDYWTDNDFTKPVTRHIEAVLQSLG